MLQYTTTPTWRPDPVIESHLDLDGLYNSYLCLANAIKASYERHDFKRGVSFMLLCLHLNVLEEFHKLDETDWHGHTSECDTEAERLRAITAHFHDNYTLQCPDREEVICEPLMSVLDRLDKRADYLEGIE